MSDIAMDFYLDHCGLGSELNNMYIAVDYCLKNEIYFRLNDLNWLYGRYTDYFFPFTRNCPGPFKEVITTQRYESEGWKTIRSHDVSFEDMSAIIKNLWQPQYHIQQTAQKYKSELKLNEYSSLIIRGGDKIKTNEAKFIEIEKYIDALEILPLFNKQQPIFVATDDYTYFEKLVSYKPQYNYITLTPNYFRGMDIKELWKWYKKDLYNFVVYLIINMEILKQSKSIVCTYSSNYSRIVPCLMSNNGYKNVKSLDLEWKSIYSKDL